MVCNNCGKETPDGVYCVFCGSTLAENDDSLESVAVEAPVVAPVVEASPSADKRSAEKTKNPYRSAFIALGSIAACLAVLVVVALATAEIRTVIDVEAYTRGTGVYDVTDDHKPPCYVGEGWRDCINKHVDEYNGACANRNLSTSAMALCDGYSKMIDEMKADDGGYGWQVETLGTWGHLEVKEQKEVVPAVTHEAVCYLGFIGECLED